MDDANRFKLRFGPYRSPRCRVGRWLTCAVSGKVRVVGISDAPIAWPLCLASTHRVPIVCGGLLRALQSESVQAVRHWWGLTVYMAWHLRKEIRAPRFTPGTRELQRDWTPERFTGDVRERARQVSHSPERAAKIAAAKRGKSRPPDVVEKMRRAATGRKASAETRAKMSATHRQRGTRPPAAGEPWEPVCDALLGTMPDNELAVQIGRDANTVYRHRKELGIANHRSRKGDA